MILEVGLFTEATVTYVTSERPGTVVHIHMTSQIPWSWERLLAQLTFMRLLLKQTQTFLFNTVALEVLTQLAFYLNMYRTVFGLRADNGPI